MSDCCSDWQASRRIYWRYSAAIGLSWPLFAQAESSFLMFASGAIHWPSVVLVLLLVLLVLGVMLYRLLVRLRSGRERFRKLFYAVPEPMWLMEQGRIVDCNLAFVERLGYASPEGVLNRQMEEFSPVVQPDGEASSNKFYRYFAAVMDGVPQEFEWLCHTQDGSSLVFELRMSPMQSRSKNLVLCCGFDLTERMNMERALQESERQFRQFFEKNSSVMLLIRPDSGQIVRANLAATQFYGYSVEQLLDMSINQINTANPEDLAYERYQALLEKRSYFNFVHRIASGALRDVEVHVSPVFVGGEALLFSLIVDVTERRRAEKRLNLAASVFTHAREGIMITDTKSCIIEVNDAFTAVTGYTREEAIGKTPRLLQSGRHNADFYRQLWASVRQKGYWYGEIWNRRKNGELFAVMTNISRVENEQGKVQNFVGIFSDITPLKEQQRQLEYIAHYDPLTGLPNRVLLADRLAQAMKQVYRRKQTLGLGFLDLDGFKAVNDMYGHHMGDQLLVALTSRMKALLREGDTLARLGGDEFALILVDIVDVASAEVILKRLLQAVSEPVEIDGKSVQVTVSIGVTFYPQDSADADQLLRHADQAMYQAKQSGRNRYQFFDIAHDSAEKVRVEMLEQIAQGLREQQFVLHFQPQVNMRTGMVIGAEALIRWQHPTQGLLYPGSFLGVIENHQLGVQLGEWVLEAAMQQMREWNRPGMDFQISVNMTARHLQQPDFVEYLERLLARYPDLPASRLELEILETSALDDLEHISAIIRRCRALGVSFAIDDFGTGYSSLSYLRHLPANLLKIDQSFVRDMLHDPDDLAIVNGVLNLASTFRKHVIAEGVETTSHGRLLLSLGCDFAQGYGVSRPMPAEKLPTWVENWQSLPEWKNASLRIHGPHHLPLIFALVEHRAWFRNLACMLAGKPGLAPELDGRRCRFGRWCEHEGRGLYGKLAGFQRLDSTHKRVHDLARDLLDLRQTTQADDAMIRALEKEIELESDVLQDLLWELIDGQLDME